MTTRSAMFKRNKIKTRIRKIRGYMRSLAIDSNLEERSPLAFRLISESKKLNKQVLRYIKYAGERGKGGEIDADIARQMLRDIITVSRAG